MDALKKLHAGHYLHLPVTVGLTPVGLVDVQQLTMAMLNYLMKKEYSASLANHGPSPLPGEAAAAVDGAGAGAGAINSSVPESGPMVKKYSLGSTLLIIKTLVAISGRNSGIQLWLQHQKDVQLPRPLKRRVIVNQ